VLPPPVLLPPSSPLVPPEVPLPLVLPDVLLPEVVPGPSSVPEVVPPVLLPLRPLVLLPPLRFAVDIDLRSNEPPLSFNLQSFHQNRVEDDCT
jgi:hypothetical protein